VTWTPAFYARRYQVMAQRTSGRRELLLPVAGQRRVTVRGLRRGEGVRVSVVGLSVSSRRGPAATARLKAAKRRR
jgi:hypothetical protein